MCFPSNIKWYGSGGVTSQGLGLCHTVWGFRSNSQLDIT